MRIYTFDYGRIVAGVVETTHEKLGRVVRLGERGRGRWESLVTIRGLAEKFDRCHPIVSERVIGDSPKKFVTLVPERQPDSPDILMIVDASGPYTRNTSGFVGYISGKCDILTMGWGAHGDAGRLGRWFHGLLLCGPDAIFRVKPFGGDKSPEYVVFIENGAPVCLERDEYDTLQALRAVDEPTNQPADQPTE